MPDDSFTFIIASVIGVGLWVVFIVLLYITKQTRDAGDLTYTPKDMYCPYIAPNKQCNKIDTATMDKLPCKDCEYYPKNQKQTHHAKTIKAK